MTANPNNPAFADVGCDISHWNAGLDFKALHGDGGRRTIFLKLTEGTNREIDPSFVPNVQALIDLDLGYDLACYHFAHGGEVKAQIDNFLTGFKNAMAKLSYAPKFHFMLDIERGANPPTEGDAREMVVWLNNAGIPNPIIYCGYDFFSTKWAEMRNCSHFLAAYNNHPVSALPWRIPSPTVYGFDWWQYTDGKLGPWAKKLAGGGAGIDLSVFNLAKHPEGAAAWWSGELAKLHQPGS